MGTGSAVLRCMQSWHALHAAWAAAAMRARMRAVQRRQVPPHERRQQGAAQRCTEDGQQRNAYHTTTIKHSRPGPSEKQTAR